MSKPDKDKKPKYDKKKKFTWGDDDKVTITKAPKSSKKSSIADSLYDLGETSPPVQDTILESSSLPLRELAIKVAYLYPETRKHLMPLLRTKTAEEEAATPKPKGKGGVPPRFKEFLQQKYQGGKKKVSNPNTKTRSDFPQVSTSTALKDKFFFQKVLIEFKQWEKNDKEKGKSDGGAKKPKKDTDKSKKPAKVEEVDTTPAREIGSDFSSLESYYKEWRDHYTGIPSTQRDAIITYTGSSYEGMNSILRTGSMPSYSWWVKEDMEKAIKGLDDFFASPKGKLKEKTLVHRGVKGGPLLEAFKDGTLGVGDVIEDKGYSSTSVKASFASNWIGYDKIVAVITAPKGSRAAYVEPITSNSGEYEMLLDRGAKFRVDKIDKSNNKVHITLLA